MSDPLLRELDHYVVLEPGSDERILSAAETCRWLQDHLDTLGEPPGDLAGLADAEARALRLLDTACELELAPGFTIQWFAVRLEPPGSLS
ncbi:chlororespiratory reduction protein 7 [Synechococcus sp. CCY 9618]|uniref:chlororespiratory reduction protein 7 n=1 Tax=Synechococcus sp. CCY 9618 TaxID=2815602 RepID=UPI001C22951F|nr:chlororespiratory reduction protein 7 [Synechococcus sp. CCY 9618]